MAKLRRSNNRAIYSQPQKAFVLRVAPRERGENRPAKRINRVHEALESNEIIIGWGEAGGLTDAGLSRDDFRSAVQKARYPDDKSLRRAGRAAAHLWRFIREMVDGDLVLVPSDNNFYVARVNGPAYFDPTQVQRGTAYRRTVVWMNKVAPLPRSALSPPLQAMMNRQGTSHDAKDFLAEILALPLAWGALHTPQAADLPTIGQPNHVLSETNRILRDTATARELKGLHRNKCQLCGLVIEIGRGQMYSEAHHIQPLGSEHRGPDIRENILILCPNCHAKCDYGAIRLDLKRIQTIPHHKIGAQYVAYHNKWIWKP